MNEVNIFFLTLFNDFKSGKKVLLHICLKVREG